MIARVEPVIEQLRDAVQLYRAAVNEAAHALTPAIAPYIAEPAFSLPALADAMQRAETAVTAACEDSRYSRTTSKGLKSARRAS